jgi:hypothetical protein
MEIKKFSEPIKVPLMTRMEEIEKLLNSGGKVKKVRLKGKAKVRRNKAKKGWVGVLKINENNSLTLEKTRVEGSAFDTKDGTDHATDGSEILWWEGKFPIIVQETKKKNPYNFRFNTGHNETYGQKYIMAKQQAEIIKPKRKAGGLIVILIILAAVAVVTKLLKLW